MIESITLDKVIPEVFAIGDYPQHNISGSEIWGKNISFLKGNSYLIEAESGAGKTSLCSFIMGTRRDYSGQVYIDNKAVTSLSVSGLANLRKYGIAWLPQEIGLFPHLTVSENINIKNDLTGYRSKKWIEEHLSLLGLEEKIHEKAARLSIGQQQRVALIRTLCQPADFIMLDEPVSHLDDRNNAIVAKLIEEDAASSGAGIIVMSVGNRLKLTDYNTVRL